MWNAAASLVYLFPLSFLFLAFMTETEKIVPAPESLGEFFREYPVTALREAIAAMLGGCHTKERINDRKASRLGVATLLTAVATAIVLIEQFVMEIVHA